MVAVFTGAERGLERGSGTILGNAGLVGNSAFGQAGLQVFANAANGNLVVRQKDAMLVGRGPDADVTRTYNSQGGNGNLAGNNFWGAGEQRLNITGVTATGGTATLGRQDGSTVSFDWDGSKFVSTDGAGAYDTLRKQTDGSYVFTDGATLTTEFYGPDQANGFQRLYKRVDAAGNALTFAYDPNLATRLTSITADNGDSISFTYDTTDNARPLKLLATTVRFTDTATTQVKLRTTRYGYDSAGNLTSTTWDLTPDDNSIADGKIYRVDYTYTDGKLSKIAGSDGSQLDIGYSAGKVSTLTETVGASVTRTTTIAIGSSESTVTDALGQVTRMTYNADGTLASIVAPPAVTGATAQVTSFTYNAKGDVTRVTDPLGRITSFTYDANGNAISEVDRLGVTVTRTFDARNRLLTETRIGSDANSPGAAHTDRYVYNAAGMQRFAISGAGRVTERRYDTYGNVSVALSYTDQFYDLTNLSTSSAPSEVDMANWVKGLSDQTAVEQTVYQHDIRGNVIRQLDYAASTSPGAPSDTENYREIVYRYDQAGRLVARTQTGENTETFVYDGLGRLVASTDVNGGTTNVLFDDPGTQTVVTLANGLVRYSTYNKAGDLIAMSEAGDLMLAGGATFDRDQLGRVRVTSGSTGIKSYMIYDRVGRKVADIGEQREITEYRYDANDRLVATIRYDTKITAAALDVVAKPYLSPDIADIRPAASTSDLWTWQVYDAKGRVIETIDGAGNVVASSYDASDRLVMVRDYATQLTAAQLTTLRTTPPSVQILPTETTVDRVTRSFYDADGNLIGSLDGAGYLQVMTYDAAGNRIAETAYAQAAGQSVRASGTLGEILATITPGSADRTTRYVYDRQGFLRFEIDPLNHVVEYTYANWPGGTVNGKVRSTTSYAGTIATLGSYTLASVRAALSAANLTYSAANRTSFAIYDAAGRLGYAIAADGAVVQYRYDTMGDVVSTTRFATLRPTSGRPTHAELDTWAANNVNATRDRTSRNYYSDARQLRYAVDGEGYVTRNDYDAAGRLIATARFPTAVTVTDTTTVTALAAALTGTAATTTYGYDVMDRLLARRDPNGIFHSFVYNAIGTIAQDVVAQGSGDERRTQFAYDGAGRVITTTDALGTSAQTVRQTSYNAFGDVLTETDPLGRSTAYAYDRRGQLQSRTDANGGLVSYLYNAFGEQTAIIDARGNPTFSNYNNDGQLVATLDPENYVTNYTYNPFGEVATVTRRANKAVERQYAPGETPAPTAFNVAASTADAVTSFGYDRLGRVTTTTDAEGFVETTLYNAFGQAQKFTNKLGGGTDYVYDRRGLLTAEYVIAPVYNAAGEQTATGYYAHQYRYDARGNRIRDTEAAGLPEQRVTNYVYDSGDRLISKSGSAVGVGLPGQTTVVIPTETYTYDARGNRTSITDAVGARTQFYYDKLDRVTAELRTFGATGNYIGSTASTVGVLTYHAYDANGNRVRTRVFDTPVTLNAPGSGAPAAPAGDYRETRYAYDTLNRLTTTTVTGIRTGAWNGTQYTSAVTSLVTTQQYDANGNVIRTAAPDGGQTFSYYDRAGRKIAEVDKENYLTTWTRDAEGNAVLERRSAARVSAPAVGTIPTLAANDAADRVTAFTYDRKGQRRTEARRNVLAATVNPTTGALTTATATATISYSYNALGAVTRKTEATGDYVDYTYDTAGRLTRETRAPFVDQTATTVRPTVDYRYDGLGDLVRTVEGGTRVTSYVYGAGGRLQSSTDAGGTTRNYFYDAIGRKVGESYTRSGEQEAYTYKYDAAGQLTYQGYAAYTQDNGWFTIGSNTTFQYNVHGDMVARAVNGVTQERIDYDRAGRIWRSNSDDGVTRVYVYDAAGNQTLKIESDGADLSTLTVDQALALTTNQGAVAIGTGGVGQTVATFTTFDKRGMATATILPPRTGSADTSAATTRTYNAFGEIASDTDALGNVTSYAYNALGRRTVITHPVVGVTSEAGVTTQTNPIERMFYDISGRLVATQNANGTTTTRTLQAGTGYGKGDPLVAAEWRPDGSVTRNAYDVFGDLRIATDALGQQQTMAYDAMGRLVQSTSVDGSIDGYAYDSLGRRISHSNSGYQTIEGTAYDVEGRVTGAISFGGDGTTTRYSWDASAVTTGLGAFGAWVETTTYANGRTIVEATDTFAHLITRTDLGSHVFSYGYDLAGRIKAITTADEQTSYTYANTGLVSTVSVGRGDATTAGSDFLTTNYGYDKRGLKTSEWTRHHKVKEEFQNGVRQAVDTTETLQNATASYDAMRRMTAWSDAVDRDGAQANPANRIAYLYDAVGNIRRAEVTYNNLDANGAFVAGGYQDQWFRYDTLNRVVTNKGALTNGTIVRGAIGSDVTYDAAGRRATVTTNVAGTTRRESYSYLPEGQLSGVAVGTVAADGTYQAGGTSSLAYDGAGRLTRQIDSDASGVAYDRSVTYNEKGQALSETVTQRQGSDTIVANTTTDYGAGATYALGAPVTVTTSGKRNGQATTTSQTSFTYEYFDGPLQSTITYKPDVNGNVSNSTAISYTGQGVLFSAQITDARPRSVSYQADALGQVIRRDESDNRPTTGDPHELWFRFDGRELGHVSNNGTLETDYATSVATRTAAQGTGAFRNGATTGTAAAEFGSDFQPITSYDQGSAGGIYTVRNGDTLQSIAQRLYGDETLWYKIAQANGLSTETQLIEGQILNLPRGVVRNANSTTSFRPYDPNAVVGDIIPDETSPTQPQPQVRKKKNKCGILGAILLAVVAVVVTVATAGTLTGAATALGLGKVGGAIVGGALAAAAGSIASQSVGVVTGIQDRFSFKGVALAALAGGVSAGLGKIPGLSGADGSVNFAQGVARGALGNALTQGVAVVTGLQSRFDFAGVAVGGVVGGVVAGASQRINLPEPAGRLVTGTAASIAGAATRSLIDGSSFGDNIVAALPDVIGSTIGDIVAGALKPERPTQTAMAGTRLMGSGGILSGLASGVTTAVQASNVQNPEIVVVARREKEGFLTRLWNSIERGVESLQDVWRGADRLVSQITMSITRPVDELRRSIPGVNLSLGDNRLQIGAGLSGVRLSGQGYSLGTSAAGTYVTAGSGRIVALADGGFSARAGDASLSIRNGEFVARAGEASIASMDDGIVARAGGLSTFAESVNVLGSRLPTVNISYSPIATIATPVTQSVGSLRSLGLRDAHHVIQDAAVRNLPGYDSRLAPGIQLEGPSTLEGSAHYNATQAQRVAGGGTYGAERQIAYGALRAAGRSNAQARQALQEADAYFNSIGVTEDTPTRIPGNRRP
ncbi:LysM peptidoglycan-binding domain-containing protein [uncultured Sphingomonas sp.]|uniref:LysM peptidoglycan-binding domain-containing protein n=1 Tax=uncultured Sphingomonas sp. TaxID=158754 RepID=UPI0030F60C98